MKKRKMSRIISFILCLVLAASLSVSVSAEPVVQGAENNAAAEENLKGAAGSSDTTSDENNDTELEWDEGEDLLTDEEGNLYTVDIEDETSSDEVRLDELLSEAKEALAIQEDSSGQEIISYVYETAISMIPAGTGRKEASSFLNELLLFANADSVLVSGTDENNAEIAWVLVRSSDEEPYYILDPIRDVEAEEETEDESEWLGFLLGTEDIAGWIPSEEFLTEEFTAAHPVSETAFVEPVEADPEETGTEEEAAGDADREETAVEEEDTEDPDTEKTDSEKTDSEKAAHADADKKDSEEADRKDSEEADKKDASDPEKASEEVSAEKEEAAEETAEKDETKETEEESGEALKSYTYASGSFSSYSNVSWEITTSDWNNYALFIRGSGSMPSYGEASSYPYYNYTRYLNITTVIIGADITSVGSCAFMNMSSLKTVSFRGRKVYSIGYMAFKNCTGLLRVILKPGLNYIGYEAFSGCTGLKSITVPSTVYTIYGYAFYGCTSLKINVPASVTSVGYDAFNNCAAVYYAGNSTRWESIGGNNSNHSSYTKVYYKINLKGNSKVKIKLSNTKPVYNGKARRPSVTVTYKGRKLRLNTDFTVTYNNNKKVGIAYAIIKGINRYKGTISKKFQIIKRSIKKARVTGVKNVGYTGTKRTFAKLKVKVKVGSKYVTLKKGRDYVVIYYNNKNISTSKKKATVKIVGKGNYKGVIKKTFKIVKATPKLKFTKTTLKRKSLSGSFTRRPRKSVKDKLTFRFYSSNKAVATVNKKTGKVTPKKVGTTRITVVSNPTKNYKAAKTSYKLTVRPLVLSEIGYSFSNYSTDYIPYDTFQLFYNGSTAADYYYNYYQSGNTGTCFGISTSAMLMNTPGSGIKPSDFSSYADHPLYFDDYYYKNYYYPYKGGSVYLREIVEAMFVSQFCPACNDLLWNRNLNDIGGLVKQVKTGKPVVVGITGKSGGHAVVAYKVRNVSDTLTDLYIYDCNYPETKRCITLYRSGGYYYGWGYYWNDKDFWSSNDGYITYIPVMTYKSIWKNRGAYRSLSQLSIASDNFEIRDSEGVLVASMTDGEFTSNTDGIFMGYGLGAELKNHLINMPVGEYTITNTDPSAKDLELGALGNGRSVVVETEAASVTINLSDETEAGTAAIEAKEGESFEVVVNSDVEGQAEPERMVFTGEGSGEEVKVGVEEGACIMDNAEGVVLEVNGEELARVEA